MYIQRRSPTVGDLLQPHQQGGNETECTKVLLHLLLTYSVTARHHWHGSWYSINGCRTGCNILWQSHQPINATEGGGGNETDGRIKCRCGHQISCSTLSTAVLPSPNAVTHYIPSSVTQSLLWHESYLRSSTLAGVEVRVWCALEVKLRQQTVWSTE